MPAYKDEKQNTWYCLFYYRDWQGNKKKKQKRGFRTKKEALEWENNYKLMANANMDMTMGAFVEIYFRDKKGELKERSVKNKRYMIEAHILPYFKDRPMNSITPSDIIQWQNIMIGIKAIGSGSSNAMRVLYQNEFNDFQQHDYDFQALEKALLSN